MNDKNVNCADLYKQYLELEAKTDIPVQNYIPGKDLIPTPINGDDLLKREEIRRQLLVCKNELDLKPEEWFEIEKA